MLRRIGLGCGGLIVVILVLSALGAFGRPASPPVTPTPPISAATLIQPATPRPPTVTSVVPTDTPITAAAPTPTTVPAPTETTAPVSAPTVPPVGNGTNQSADGNGVRLTLNTAKLTASINPLLHPAAGNTYLLLDVTIINLSSSQQPYNPLYFKVKTPDGYEYNATVFGPANVLKSGQLAGGDKARGTIAFEVPASNHQFTVEYLPLVLLSGDQPLLLSFKLP